MGINDCDNLSGWVMNYLSVDQEEGGSTFRTRSAVNGSTDERDQPEEKEIKKVKA